MSLFGSFGQSSHASPIPSSSVSIWSKLGVLMQLSSLSQTTWIGDFNPKMIKVCESFLGSDIYQKLTTYRFLFDEKAEFIPHPIIK